MKRYRKFLAQILGAPFGHAWQKVHNAHQYKLLPLAVKVKKLVSISPVLCPKGPY
jgi:hypothetical protein